MSFRTDLQELSDNMIHELVTRTRTVRRFQENKPIEDATIQGLVQLARLGGSARNSQPLRYMIVIEEEMRARVFPHLGWAGYLRDWSGPEEGERPSAYIICLLVKDRCVGPEYEAHFDLGISTQNILLGAAEQGIYGCRIGSFSKKLAHDVEIDNDHKILLVLALGYPAEQIVLEEVQDDDVRYWRDNQGVHHVPKRPLNDIIYPVTTEGSGSGIHV